MEDSESEHHQIPSHGSKPPERAPLCTIYSFIFRLTSLSKLWLPNLIYLESVVVLKTTQDKPPNQQCILLSPITNGSFRCWHGVHCCLGITGESPGGYCLIHWIPHRAKVASLHLLGHSVVGAFSKQSHICLGLFFFFFLRDLEKRLGVGFSHSCFPLLS